MVTGTGASQMMMGGHVVGQGGVAEVPDNGSHRAARAIPDFEEIIRDIDESLNAFSGNSNLNSVLDKDLENNEEIMLLDVPVVVADTTHLDGEWRKDKMGSGKYGEADSESEFQVGWTAGEKNKVGGRVGSNKWGEKSRGKTKQSHASVARTKDSHAQDVGPKKSTWARIPRPKSVSKSEGVMEGPKRKSSQLTEKVEEALVSVKKYRVEEDAVPVESTPEKVAKMVTYAWALWSSRNDIRQGGKRKTGLELVRGATQYLEEFHAANTVEEVHISSVGQDKMRITWITKASTKPIVYFSETAGVYQSSVLGTSSSYKYMAYKSDEIHEVVISPLKPDTLYFYRCGENSTEEYFLRTPPAEFPIKFSVSGDLGQTEWTNSTLQHISQSNYDMLLLPVDLAYADFLQSLWDSFGSLVEPLTDFDFESPQYKWLEADLRKVYRNVTPWTVVLIHAPWYNSNTAHQGEKESDDMKKSMEALIFLARVDIVFAGHVNAYKRFSRVYNGNQDNCAPVYINIGDGGNREGLATTYQDPKPSICVFREASFGHGELDMVNATHALWTWHRNQDDQPVVSDSLLGFVVVAGGPMMEVVEVVVADHHHRICHVTIGLRRSRCLITGARVFFQSAEQHWPSTFVLLVLNISISQGGAWRSIWKVRRLKDDLQLDILDNVKNMIAVEEVGFDVPQK
nr:putative purple acid phosphatase 20 [Quercus suber]